MSVVAANVTTMVARKTSTPSQLSFDEFAPVDDESLQDTTFVVVDLETTGSCAAATPGRAVDAITEIGAVKVRGGVVLGEFGTLVDPQRSIPPQITQLTGITTAMVTRAPRIESVLPAFLEFAGYDRGSVLVAHNAGFDVGFLRAAAERCDLAWPKPKVLCTVRLARRVLSRDEAPNVRLGSLAQLFAVSTRPNHRALDDARATVDVLHALIERVGNQGVRTFSDLRAFLPGVTTAQRRKRMLADGLPHRPGVYLFRAESGEVLYVGTSGDLRRRVAQYFNGSDRRARMKEMVALTATVDHVECAHSLEAGVRELRLLAAHAPPYNRKSKFPYRWWWVALTDEPFPRLAVLRAPRTDRVIGPFRSRAEAAETAELVARFTGLRTCTAKLGRSALHGTTCPLREIAPCPAPRGATATEYAAGVARAADLIDGMNNTALGAAIAQVDALAGHCRYESAARLRDQTASTIETLWRTQRMRSLSDIPELVAAKPVDRGGRTGYELAVIRYGQLAAGGVAGPSVPPMPVVEALTAGAQTILPSPGPLGGAMVEETSLIARWLTTPGVRIVRAGGDGWISPLHSAGRWADWAATARSARLAAEQTRPDTRAPEDHYPGGAQRVDLDFVAEPRPSRQELFGRTGIDRSRSASQAVLPRRKPFGATG